MSWFNANFQSVETSAVSLHDGRSSHEQEISRMREQNARPDPTLNEDNERVRANANLHNLSRTKRRKLTSKVWEEFTRITGKDGKLWAVCNHCKNTFDGSSKKVTTHLNNHLESCGSSDIDERGAEAVADETGTLTNSIVIREKMMINQELNHLDVIRAIIKYGFSKLNFIKPDILHVYQEEKEKLGRYLTNVSCRFSIAIKWVDECFSMALHFIDDNWDLKQKIISFHPGTNGDFFETLKESLLDWSVSENICSIVINFDKEGVNEEIENWLSARGLLPFGGRLLSVCSLSYFLKSHTWTEKTWPDEKIKKSFDFVNMSTKRLKFEIALDKAKYTGKKVISRSIPKWAYGFEGLEAAVGFKEAFLELEEMDSDFKVITLTGEEWDKATAIYEFLKVLTDASRCLSATKCTTANAFFPKVCDIYMKLLLWESSRNKHVHGIASRIRERFFNEYWCKYKLLLAIAVFVDPRFKMDIIERWYKEIYGIFADANLKEIVDGVGNVYNEYARGHSKMLDEMGRPCISSPNSELELYSKEPNIPSIDDFDILAWWRTNNPRFPILARMARDFLAVPISPMAFSDSPLNTEIDNITFCYGLDVDIKPALVCIKSWLESPVNK